MDYFISPNEDLNNSIDKTSQNIVSNENMLVPVQTFEATDDESMAVEALRQLGGMYQNVVTTEQSLPLLSCTVCNIKFQTTADLRVHLETCTEFPIEVEIDNNKKCFVTKLPCKYCFTYFDSRTDMDKHIQVSHHSARPFVCHYCDMRFIRSSSLANHLKIHNYVAGRDQKILGPDPDNVSSWSFQSIYVPDNPANNSNDLQTWNLNYVENNDNVNNELPIKVEVPNTPEICLGEYPITSMPQMEVTIENSKKSRICPHCGMSFSREKALIAHIKIHSIEWIYECDYCEQKFPNENSKQEHHNICDANKTQKNNIPIKKPDKPPVKVGKHSCQECSKSFATKQKMFRHLWVHRKKMFTCEICAVSFQLQSELDTHRLTEHPADSPYVCTECGKSFASRQGLWEHGRLHGANTSGMYTCNKCNKTFSSRQGFLIHHRTHTNERPYGCRFCLKAFRDGGTLRKHERIHTGCRPYVCPICSHDFNQKVVLREHVRWIHTANKSEAENGGFICELCNSTISDREELCVHIVKHSDLIALQAKNSERSFPNSKAVNNFLNDVGKKQRKKNVSPKISTNIKTEIVDLNDEQFNVSSTNMNFECEMCGDKFSSQKDLMTHVQIHI